MHELKKGRKKAGEITADIEGKKKKSSEKFLTAITPEDVGNGLPIPTIIKIRFYLMPK